MLDGVRRTVNAAAYLLRFHSPGTQQLLPVASASPLSHEVIARDVGLTHANQGVRRRYCAKSHSHSDASPCARSDARNSLLAIPCNGRELRPSSAIRRRVEALRDFEAARGAGASWHAQLETTLVAGRRRPHGTPRAAASSSRRSGAIGARNFHSPSTSATMVQASTPKTFARCSTHASDGVFSPRSTNPRYVGFIPAFAPEFGESPPLRLATRH